MSKEICQLDENYQLVATFNDAIHIAKKFEYFDDNGKRKFLNYQCFNQAVKKGFKSHGFFWMLKVDYEKFLLGEYEPKGGKSIRNLTIYAYKPKEDIPKRLFKEFSHLENEMEFVGRYRNAVDASTKLKVSVSNVRSVLNGVKGIHKGFWFSFTPLSEDDEDTANKLERELIFANSRR